ncbi:prepilin-type N-terminal cleavage/methylation domain-containing protein [Planctomycetota bacterium]|nr:prepilin-type N-terminal cleavage/methylation domain-containing protein [Planctomycetota bacterium]
MDQNEWGFTLPEVLLASVILAFVVAALTQAIVSGQMQTYNALQEKRAMELAESLMEEITVLAYVDSDGSVALGPEGDENDRGDFDNLDDYHGYIQSSAGISDIHNHLLPEVYQSYSREASVEYVTVSIPQLGGDYEGVLISITVINKDLRNWSLKRFVPKPVE